MDPLPDRTRYYMVRRRRHPELMVLGVVAGLLAVGGVVMATGGPSRASTSSTASPVHVAAAPAATPQATPTLSPTQPPTPMPSITAAPGTKPWLAWKPTGNGEVTLVNMPAPWTNAAGYIDVYVYTPPGYDPNGTRLYPVVYEAPTGLGLWDGSTGTIAQLNSLIDSGAMPAAIVVFIDESDPPLSPSECVDSANKEQWFETYILNVVQWVDSHYDTLPDPRARAVMGMSEGGFCAAMLASRHPGIFSVSISFSGYYWAGTAGGGSAAPYANQTDMDAHSPALLVPNLSPEVQASMYFEIVADDSQFYFGAQATSFEKILSANGVDYLAVNDPSGHGWTEVQDQEPKALEAWAARMVISGIW
jgi:enterochelin esterase-like enzyme